MTAKPETAAEVLAEMKEAGLKRWADRLERALSAQGEAVAWIRYCSDGTFEGPIHNSQMDDIRRRSSVWEPLTHPAPARVTETSCSASDVETVARKLFESEQRSRRGEWTWDECCSIEREGWTELALAAIEILQPAALTAALEAGRHD